MIKSYKPTGLPLKDINYNRLIEQISSANRSIATYNGLLQSIPNKYILLTPLITQEAVLSSKIEGTQATLQEVLEFEADSSRYQEKKQDIIEIRNYRQAMQYAVKELDKLPLCLRMIKNMHKILMSEVRGHDKNPGSFRSIQNWIGKPGSSIENASFIPPEPHILQEHLSNLEKYIHTNDRDYLVQAGIIHSQFEILHPFLDGNGRIGRMLIPLFFYVKGIMSEPVFYISEYFEANREEYYQRLRNISKKNDWNGWITFFLQAVIGQSQSNIEKIKKITALYKNYEQKMVDITKSKRSITIVETLFRIPVFKAVQFAELSKIPQKTTERYLKLFLDKKIISVNEKEKRRTYIFNELMDILS